MNKKMTINFIVEDFWNFRYLGCCTAARYLYYGVNKIADTKWNSDRRDFDIVHMHTFGPKAMLYKKLVKSKKILTAHSTPRLNENNIAYDLKLNLIYKKVYNTFDHIIAITESGKNELTDLGIKTPITVISNCVDLQKFKYSENKRKNFRERYSLYPSDFVILNVAQQTPRKGIYDFIKIAETCKDPNVKFIWVGDMPYSFLSKDFFKIKKLKEKCTNNLRFIGFVDDIVEAYCGADLFLMPSYAETFGMVILEAMASGADVIARDIPEFREVFDNNITYFKNTDDVCELIQKKIASNDKSRRLNEYIKKYDQPIIAKKHLDFYNSII